MVSTPRNKPGQYALKRTSQYGVVECGVLIFEDTECAFSNELILWEVEFCMGGFVGTGVMHWRC